MTSVTFFIFQKKINSTKRPSVLTDTYTNYSVALKDGCSISNPVLMLTWSGTGADVTPSRYNYAYISDFHRYYWVNDWISVGNARWEVQLNVDPLATYRQDIGNSNCYVLRANSTLHADGLITDALYPMKTRPEITTSNITNGFSSNFMQGNFVVGIINSYYSNSNINQGAVTYYGMTAAQFGAFKNALLNDTDWLYTAEEWDLDVSQSTLKALFNPFQYVTSVIWMPFSALELGMIGGTSDVYIGWWKMKTQIQAYLLSNATINTQVGVGSIVANPAAVIGTDPNFYVDSKLLYLNYPPYSRYIAHLAPFGDFELDGQIAGKNLGSALSYDVIFRADIDLITGQALLYSAKLLSGSWIHDGMIETSCQIGIPIQIAQITSNTGAGIVSVLNSAASIANSASLTNLTLNPAGAVASGIASAAAGIYNAVEAMAPHMGKSDSNGSVAAIASQRYLMSEHWTPVEMAPQEQGYPVCKNLEIGLLSGFIKTAASDVIAGEATNDEISAVRAAMDAGFYFE